MPAMWGLLVDDSRTVMLWGGCGNLDAAAHLRTKGHGAGLVDTIGERQCIFPKIWWRRLLFRWC